MLQETFWKYIKMYLPGFPSVLLTTILSSFVSSMNMDSEASCETKDPLKDPNMLEAVLLSNVHHFFNFSFSQKNCYSHATGLVYSQLSRRPKIKHVDKIKMEKGYLVFTRNLLLLSNSIGSGQFGSGPLHVGLLLLQLKQFLLLTERRAEHHKVGVLFPRPASHLYQGFHGGGWIEADHQLAFWQVHPFLSHAGRNHDLQQT